LSPEAGAISLRTARLLLRPWRDSDFAPFAALNADPRVMEHYPAVLSRDESDRLAVRLRGDLEANGHGLWAVEIPGQADFIGYTGLWRPTYQTPFTPCVEIGWRIAAAHWGRGYATEAARAALEYAFDSLKLDEVVSFTVPANRRSLRVMEKLGLTRDLHGDFEHPLLPVEHPLRPHVLYRIRPPGR
jgi:RimJ/RimL family protein N-acetyltransferase